jgi:hypothetical protein
MISIEKTYRDYGGKTYQSDSNTSQNILVKAIAYVFFCAERTGKAGYRHEKGRKDRKKLIRRPRKEKDDVS